MTSPASPAISAAPHLSVSTQFVGIVRDLYVDNEPNEVALAPQPTPSADPPLAALPPASRAVSAPLTSHPGLG